MSYSLRPPSSELEADAARELAVRRFGLGQISCPLEALAHLQQVRRQIGAPHVDGETFDETTSRGNGSAGLPEGTPLARARLHNAPRQVKRATRFDLAHALSLRGSASADIRAATESRCGLLLKLMTGSAP
jgi:hypothetical protein